MSCPDIDSLVDFHATRGPDREFEAHLENCAFCRSDLEILGRISAAFRPEAEVPERLIRRVMAALPGPDSAEELQRRPVAQTLVAGVLGSVTALTAVVGSESVGSGSLPQLLLFSLGVGAVSVVLQTRAQSTIPPTTV
ncbi:MAG: hypothetical protein KJN92_07270 [Gemmatimonadetes bacterium]|nr:hypothetical protein [Gemmatimonadota bacterium]